MIFFRFCTWVAIVFVLLFVAYILRGFTLLYRKQILSFKNNYKSSRSSVILARKTNVLHEINKRKVSGFSLFTRMQNSLLYTYSMLLQVSLPRLPEVWAIRVFIGWWWLYTILITVSYRASLTATLTNPIAR